MYGAATAAVPGLVGDCRTGANDKCGFNRRFGMRDRGRLNILRSIRPFGYDDPDRFLLQFGGIELLQLLPEFVCARPHRRVLRRRVAFGAAQHLDPNHVLSQVGSGAPHFRFADEPQEGPQLLGTGKSPAVKRAFQR